MIYTPCVYVIIITTAGPEAYFKIGISGNLDARIDAVQTGCPLPIERVLYLPTENMAQAKQFERSFHARFREHHSSGEWFAFDISDESQKAEFKRGCCDVLDPSVPGWKWVVFDEAAYRADKEKARALRAAEARDRAEFSERKNGGGGVALAIELSRAGKGVGLAWSRGSKLRGK